MCSLPTSNPNVFFLRLEAHAAPYWLVDSQGTLLLLFFSSSIHPSFPLITLIWFLYFKKICVSHANWAVGPLEISKLVLGFDMFLWSMKQASLGISTFLYLKYLEKYIRELKPMNWVNQFDQISFSPWPTTQKWKHQIWDDWTSVGMRKKEFLFCLLFCFVAFGNLRMKRLHWMLLLRRTQVGFPTP